jgi:hypothetical protein
MLMLPPRDGSYVRARLIADAMARAFRGSLFTLGADDPRQARAASGATWVAVPMPTPRTADWLARVGQPLVTSCALPVLFVPEAEEEYPS